MAIHIRRALSHEAQAIQAISRQYPKELGYVSIPEIRKGIENKECHVAIVDNELVGYALFHTRRDNWTTLYSIAIDKNCHRSGIGSKLLWSLPTPLQLKVTQDNDRAIAFYEKLHLHIVGEKTLQSGRKMYLTKVYLMKVWLWFIYCQGNNKEIPECAKNAGIGYGTRHDNTARGDIVMLDIHWEKYNWQGYLALIDEITSYCGNDP